MLYIKMSYVRHLDVPLQRGIKRFPGLESAASEMQLLLLMVM